MRKIFFLSLLAASTLLAALPALGASYYTQKLSDADAVYLTAPRFPVRGDGVADDATAIQMAIDQVQKTKRVGIVFIPEGRYRLGRTVYVWSGIRLIGYGAHRPVFVLASRTPGFEIGDGRYLVQFAGERPNAAEPVQDPTSGAEGSDMSNIDIEIGAGNPAAVGVHFPGGAQSCLSHMDFKIGSGRAGIETVGGVAEDLHFTGGQYGIITSRIGEGRPFVLLDSSFTGQEHAAIKTEEAGLTLVRDQFTGMPTAISIDKDRADQVWLQDSRFRDIRGPAVAVSDEYNHRTQVNIENLSCVHVPLLALLSESGTQVAGPAMIYRVKSFCHGVQMDDIGGVGAVTTTYQIAEETEAPAAAPSDIPDLPARDTWANIRTLGAKGDGYTDDTAVFKDAISKYRAIYIPSGRYKITSSLVLRPDTVLIGVDPFTTQIVLPAGAREFLGVGSPKPLIEAPPGGANIVTGIGVETSGNASAVGIKWMAGAGSLMSDIYCPAQAVVMGDSSESEALPALPGAMLSGWDEEYPSLWIDGGGGAFLGITSLTGSAQSGLYISNTSTAGHVYGLVVAGHARNEVRVKNVSNWEIAGLDSQDSQGESAHALPLDIHRASHITLANLYFSRSVDNAPYSYAVKLQGTQDIRVRNVHVFGSGQFDFDNAVYDQTSGTLVRDRELASLTVAGGAPLSPPLIKSAVRDANSKAEKLVTGFNDIGGMAVDPAGNVYFVDAKWQSIYRWSSNNSELILVRDNPLDPEALAFDKAGHLIVIAGSGAVYSIDLADTDDQISPIASAHAITRPGLVPVLPTSRWQPDHDFSEVNSQPAPLQYVSPDGSTFLPAQPELSDLLHTYDLAPAVPGRPFYVADEFADETWAFSVAPDGSLTNPKLFAERGEAGGAVDALGDVYVADGEVYVYDPTGRQIDEIDVPERPTGIAFGGKDDQTLFIAARTSLYAIHMKVKGQ